MLCPWRGFHFLQPVAHVRVAELIQADGLGIVGRDRHDGDASAFVIVNELLDSILICLGGWAVVAGEDDDEHLCGSEIVKRPGLPIDARKPKRGRGSPWRAFPQKPG